MGDDDDADNTFSYYKFNGVSIVVVEILCFVGILFVLLSEVITDLTELLVLYTYCSCKHLSSFSHNFCKNKGDIICNKDGK